MTTITVDERLRAKLLASAEVAEFRDEDGTLIGQFIPAESGGEETQHGLSADELQRRLVPDCKTYSTAEVLAHLQGLR